jgi:hypothetical protein
VWELRRNLLLYSSMTRSASCGTCHRTQRLLHAGPQTADPHQLRLQQWRQGNVVVRWRKGHLAPQLSAAAQAHM